MAGADAEGERARLVAAQLAGGPRHTLFNLQVALLAYAFRLTRYIARLSLTVFSISAPESPDPIY